MLTDTPLTYVLGPIVLCGLMAYIVKWRGQTKESEPVKRAWTNFKLNTIGSGIVLVILWLALPSTPSLSTFKGLDDLRDPQLLAKYLHDYSRAVVRTTKWSTGCSSCSSGGLGQRCTIS